VYVTSISKQLQKVLQKIVKLFSFPFTANIVGSVFTDQTHNIFFSWEDFGKFSSAVNKIFIIICVSGINKTVFSLDYPPCRSVSTSESEGQSSDSLRFSFLLIVANVFFCSFYCNRDDLQFGLMLISLSYFSSSLSSVLLGGNTSWLLNGEGVTWSS